MALPVFDVLIFTGVLYHVQDPLEALKRLRARTGELALLETHINGRLGNDEPLMAFYEHDELNRDPTNWWGPNACCLEAMLRTAGFSFTQSMKIFDTAASEPSVNGRVAYLLRPEQGSVYSQVSGSATGSNSML